VSVRIADDGEIAIHGDIVFQGTGTTTPPRPR
jgi:hypothetical protein